MTALTAPPGKRRGGKGLRWMTLRVGALGLGKPPETKPLARLPGLVVETGFDNFFAAVKTVRSDMVATVRLT